MYNLVQVGEGKLPQAPSTAAVAQRLREVVQRWASTSMVNDPALYMLEHRYTKEDLHSAGVHALKDTDRALWDAVQQASAMENGTLRLDVQLYARAPVNSCRAIGESVKLFYI